MYLIIANVQSMLIISLHQDNYDKLTIVMFLFWPLLEYMYFVNLKPSTLHYLILPLSCYVFQNALLRTTL